MDEAAEDEFPDEPSGSAGDSSDEGSDAAGDEFEKDEFLVTDNEDEGGDSEKGEDGEDQIRSSRKRRRKKQVLELDEDDYLLLEDANINVNRHG